MEAVLAKIIVFEKTCGCKLCNPSLYEKSENLAIVPYHPHPPAIVPDGAIKGIKAFHEPRGGDIFEDCSVLKALCVFHEFVCACSSFFLMELGLKNVVLRHTLLTCRTLQL